MHGAELHPIRLALGRLIRPVVRALTGILGAPRVIKDRSGVSEYLSRWYILGKPIQGQEAFDEDGNPRPEVQMPRLGLYVHRFHRSDQDLALHNHPWKWALAIVLAGGYSEERRVTEWQPGPWEDRPASGGGCEFKTQYVVRRAVLPLSLNWITHDTFHRVDLYEQDAWSVFIAGPRVSNWSFWDRHTNETTPWREYLAREREKA